MMLQHDRPDDFVIATGETNTVQRCVEIAFDQVGLDWKPYVRIDDSVQAAGRGRPARRRRVEGRAGAGLEAEDELRGAHPAHGRLGPEAAPGHVSDDPTGWFEPLYAAAERGEREVPWERDEPREALVEWAEARGLDGDGLGAVVVGCGFGADAEYLSSLGFDVTAFDVAPSAVRAAQERHPGTAVHYVTADLLEFPAAVGRGVRVRVRVADRPVAARRGAPAGDPRTSAASSRRAARCWSSPRAATRRTGRSTARRGR